MAEMRGENLSLRRELSRKAAETETLGEALAAISRRRREAPEAAERWLKDDVEAARARLNDVLREAAEIEERTRRRKAALDELSARGAAPEVGDA